MNLVYHIAISFYQLIIGFVSPWNKKANQWIKGRRNWEEKLTKSLVECSNIHWFHCASLGEFEQARPLIEKIKTSTPEVSVLLTFFSPSGYEVQKNYKFADYVCYLPLDTRRKAKRFVQTVSPSKVFFVKYEVWPNFFRVLKEERVPFYLISATFRKEQIYFKSIGSWFRKLLKYPTQIFVQNEPSKILLEGYGIDSILAGDTRYDRVSDNAKKAVPVPNIEKFTKGNSTLIVGSSWPKEESMISRFIQESPHAFKTIIAPHDISEGHINSILLGLDKMKVERYSFLTESTKLSELDVIVIDNIGMLSNIYQYGSIAFIGGGFTNALHNILEPATFGLPVIYGNNQAKFPEANEMKTHGGGIEVSDYLELEKTLDSFIGNREKLELKSKLNKEFIESRIGATNIIYQATLLS